MTGTATPPNRKEAYEDCSYLDQVQVDKHVDGSLLQNFRAREGSFVDQKRSTTGTSAQLTRKGTPSHFLGFSSVVKTVPPGQEELQGIFDSLEQVQVKNRWNSSVPQSSRTSEES